MNRIDELFKNKLANHQVAPSADAWQKVEAGLTKKIARGCGGWLLHLCCSDY